MRAAIQYVFAWVVLSVFSGQVCPFIESLGLLQWTVILFVAFGLGFLARIPLSRHLIDSADDLERPRKRLILELEIFVAIGLLVAVFNSITFGFPFFGSGILAVVLGTFVLGFFASTDMALTEERALAQVCIDSRTGLDLSQSFFPLTRKFIVIATVCVLSLTAVLILVISHDLYWLSEQEGTVNWHSAQRAVLVEIIFILGVFLVMIVNLIRSYSRNLRILLDNQIDALEEVNGGKLDGFVPIFTNDEFSVIANHTNSMIDGLRNRTAQLQLTQDVTIQSLASLAETRDNETGAHIQRTQGYIRILAETLRNEPAHRDELSDETVDLLFKSAPLHDVGKVGVPDAILLKPGKLDGDEWEIMKLHTVYGHESLRIAEERLGSSSFLRLAREIALTHHERWNGSGYPEGLKGKEIPLSGRLMALADVYDAIISKRVYKPAIPHDRAREILIEGREEQFDPEVLDAFVEREHDFIETARKYSDKTIPAH